MSPLLFVVGVVLGVVVAIALALISTNTGQNIKPVHSITTSNKNPPDRQDQLDLVDEMVLYGEVTGDDFYDIMG